MTTRTPELCQQHWRSLKGQARIRCGQPLKVLHGRARNIVRMKYPDHECEEPSAESLSAAERQDLELILCNARSMGWLAADETVTATRSAAGIVVSRINAGTHRERRYEDGARWPTSCCTISRKEPGREPLSPPLEAAIEIDARHGGELIVQCARR